jgi:hypothetical protein
VHACQRMPGRVAGAPRWSVVASVTGAANEGVDHRDQRGANLKHRARSAGEPATSWWLTRVNLTQHHTRLWGCCDPGVPRALGLGAGVGNASLDGGLPGAGKEYGR